MQTRRTVETVRRPARKRMVDDIASVDACWRGGRTWRGHQQVKRRLQPECPVSSSKPVGSECDGCASPIGARYAREAVAAVIDYGLRTLGMPTIRAYTDPSNLASQKVLLRCGLKKIGEIDLVKPTRLGARRAPLFRISQRELSP